MSTNLVCFCFGIAATAFWLLGLKRGVSFPILGFPVRGMPLGLRGGMVHRHTSPGYFWATHLFYGIFALGLLLMPMLSWAGLRR
jgi:hypothetical protein